MCWSRECWRRPRSHSRSVESRGYEAGGIPAILDEYHRVGRLLVERYEGAELDPFLALVAVHAEVVDAPDLPEPVCEDPEDDKFLSCALAGAALVVVSGDKQLGRLSGWKGIEVVTPRAFVDRHVG